MRACLTGILLLLGCSDATFNGGSGHAAGGASAPESAADSPKGGGKDSLDARNADRSGTDAAGASVQRFDIDASKAPLDMVWVIDNSASMNNQHPYAQANFDGFVEVLEKRADIKLALVSMTYGSLGIKLSDTQKQHGHIQIDRAVASSNLLALAASATCPADTTGDYTGYGGVDGGQMKICGQTLDSSAGIGPLEQPDDVTAVKGTLAAALRPGARRVYVFVSDDDATFVVHSNFLKLIQPYDGKLPPRVFGFVAPKNSSCNAANPGVNYAELAKATGGATFDVCERDWSDNFAKLTDQLVGAAADHLTLAVPKVTKVVSVTADGKVLGAGDYRISGNVVSLSDRSVKHVEVTYIP